MTELCALVVTIQAPQTLTLPDFLGRATNALLLRWIDAHDAVLAKRWHDDSGYKPYTCSTLVGPKRINRQQRSLEAGDSAWFRLTTLDASIAAVLYERLAHPPQTIDLDGHIVNVTSMTMDANEHEWAGSTTYEDIAAPYLLSGQNPPRSVSLKLASPVNFRQNNMVMSIPLPDLVFGGLADKWNAFSPIAISSQVRDYARQSMTINRFNLRSETLMTKPEVRETGAKGDARYYGVNFDRYWMNIIALLADFTFYAGVGRLTALGLGQAHRLS